MDATCAIQNSIHVFSLVHINMCPGFWVHIKIYLSILVFASRKLYTNLNSMDFLHPVRQDSFFPIGIEHPEWG